MRSLSKNQSVLAGSRALCRPTQELICAYSGEANRLTVEEHLKTTLMTESDVALVRCADVAFEGTIVLLQPVKASWVVLFQLVVVHSMLLAEAVISELLWAGVFKPADAAEVFEILFWLLHADSDWRWQDISVSSIFMLEPECLFVLAAKLLLLQ